MGIGQGEAVERGSVRPLCGADLPQRNGNIHLDINHLKWHFCQAIQFSVTLFLVGVGLNLGLCACHGAYHEATLQPSFYAEMGLTTAD